MSKGRRKPPVKKPSYHTYVKLYTWKQVELARKGYQMNESILTEREYMETYEAVKNDMIMEGKKPANIARQIVTSQAYEITYRQATAARKAFKQIGEPKKLLDILSGKASVQTLYDLSSDYYHKLKDDGVSSSDARDAVSSEIWGSP